MAHVQNGIMLSVAIYTLCRWVFIVHWNAVPKTRLADLGDGPSVRPLHIWQPFWPRDDVRVFTIVTNEKLLCNFSSFFAKAVAQWLNAYGIFIRLFCLMPLRIDRFFYSPCVLLDAGSPCKQSEKLFAWLLHITRDMNITSNRCLLSDYLQPL